LLQLIHLGVDGRTLSGMTNLFIVLIFGQLSSGVASTLSLPSPSVKCLVSFIIYLVVARLEKDIVMVS